METNQKNLTKSDLQILSFFDIPLRDVNHQEEGGFCMRGDIRTNKQCPVCKKLGKKGTFFFDKREKDLICSSHFTRPKKYYVDFWYKGERIRLFKGYDGRILDSYIRAFRLLERIRGEVDNKSFDPTLYKKIDRQKYEFGRYVWQWFDYMEDDWALATKIKNDFLIRKHIIFFFDDSDIREIRSGRIAKFYKKLKGYSGNYKKQILNILKGMFTKAFEWEDIIKKPVFPKFDIMVKPFKWINREQQNIILKGIPLHNKPIFTFLFLSGCRISEITALKWDCVDYQNRLLTIRRSHSAGKYLRETTKTDDWRTACITDSMTEILKNQSRSINGYVFNNIYGNHQTYAGLWYLWGHACKKAGINITLYNAVKHSWACQRINAGFHHEEIALAFGHKNLKTTQKYIRILTENLREVFEGEKVIELNRHQKTVTKPSLGGLGE